MSHSSYYKQEYKCPSCGHISKHYVWSNELEIAKHRCPNDNRVLTIKHLHVVEINSAPKVGKMTKDQIKADRRKRSYNHFQKEILPYLPKQERVYHSKKTGKNFL